MSDTNKEILPAFIPGDYVRLTKLSEVNPGVVRIGHWAEGYLMTPVVLGKSLLMDRVRRALFPEEISKGEVVERCGCFNTSAVQLWKVVEDTNRLNNEAYDLITRNSTWRIEKC